MKRRIGLQTKALILSAILGAVPLLAAAEDIDIFTGKSAGTAAQPRILVIIENTANWSANDQHFPDATMGQAEVNAIAQAVPKLGSDVQIGVMMFNASGTKADNGGFIRSAVLPMGLNYKRADGTTNLKYLTDQMSVIYNNINSPNEKGPTGMAWGNLFMSAHDYFAGRTSFAPGSIYTPNADKLGYSSLYTKFKSPLQVGEACGKNYIIFIANPGGPSGPTPDGSDNKARLEFYNDGAITNLQIPAAAVTVTKDVVTTVGTTAACYTDATSAAAGLTPFATQCDVKYFTEGCKIGTAAPAAAQACAPGSLSYTVRQITHVPASGAAPVVGSAVLSTLPSTGTYAAKTDVPSTDKGAHTCPTATSAPKGDGTTDTTNWACTYSVGTAVTSNAAVTATGTTTTCYKGVGTAAGYWDGTDKATVATCPAGNVCTWSGATSTTCPGNKFKILVTRSAVPLVKFNIIQSAIPTTTNSGVIPAHDDSVDIGRTAGCYTTAPSATADFASQCTGTNISCTYNNPPTSTTGSYCPAGKAQYLVLGTNKVETIEIADGGTSDTASPRYADEWARMMYAKGVMMDGYVAGDVRPSVTTYAIDVYNAKPEPAYSSFMMGIARAGGGKYLTAKTQDQITAALTQVFAEIQAVNSSFASTSLPVSATNRSQNANQVFIGMFRPDQAAAPRWFGNLKRYKLISGAGNAIDLGDVNGLAAVNPLTGFVTPCAKSYWTSDSTVLAAVGGASIYYWKDKGILPDPAGTCDNSLPYSDTPDGPMVEKGAAAQVLRQGNVKNGAASLKDVNRNMLTSINGSAFVKFQYSAFATPPSGFSIDTVRFMRGEDTQDDKGTGETSTTRMSIHGDVIHSRPLPINYSFTNDTDVTVYYGANDGTFRAVDADTGVEKWSFVAEEFVSKLERLRQNTGKVTYAGGTGVGTTPKDYFFDGSTGVYQDATNSKVWLYPTMRRGGRYIYGINVADNKKDPVFMWKQGCTGSTCTSADVAKIGQTWSTPVATFIKGYEAGATPVLIVGGGYDGGYDSTGKALCEDTDNAVPAICAGVGNKVFILRADTGAVINSINTDRSVTGDIALADIDNDGMTDYAYAATLGGSIYRIDFINGPLTKVAVNPDKVVTPVLTSRRVAATNISSNVGRKFLFAPALFTSKSRIYVALASGDREHPLALNYPYPNSALGHAGVKNRMYVYMDDLTLPVATLTQDLDDTTKGMANYTVDPGCDVGKVTSTSTLKGWFMDMEKTGEQGVTSALIAGGMVTFSTNRPMPDSEGSCSTSLGEARGYWVNLLNGSGAIGVDGICGGKRSAIFVGGGLPPSPVLASSVKVDGKYVSVVIGAAQKGSDGKPPASAIIGTQLHSPAVSRKRKRTYTYTSGD